jgi:hypothetical protein
MDSGESFVFKISDEQIQIPFSQPKVEKALEEYFEAVKAQNKEVIEDIITGSFSYIDMAQRQKSFNSAITEPIYNKYKNELKLATDKRNENLYWKANDLCKSGKARNIMSEVGQDWRANWKEGKGKAVEAVPS